MGLFFDAILAPSNLWLTVLLGLCGLYWLVVVVGGLSVDTLDVDLDIDSGLDLDPGLDGAADGLTELDIEPDLAGPANPAPSIGQVSTATAIMRFFNLGDVPLMVVLTVLVFAMWAISVALHPVIGGWTPLAQLAMVLPMFIVSALLMKLVTWPVKKLFHAIREEERKANLELIGKVCRVISSQVTPSIGQAEYPTGGAPLLLNVRTRNNDALARGDEAVIIGQDKRTGVYYVRGF